MKHLLRLLVFLLFLSPLWVSTKAVTLAASADRPTCEAGAEVRLTLRADDCTENGVAGFSIDLAYDPAVFTFLGAEPLGAMFESEFSYSTGEPEGHAVLLYVDDLAGGSPLRGKGVALCTVTLLAKADAPEGESTVAPTEMQFAAHGEAGVTVLPCEGGGLTLTVKRPESAAAGGHPNGSTSALGGANGAEEPEAAQPSASNAPQRPVPPNSVPTPPAASEAPALPLAPAPPLQAAPSALWRRVLPDGQELLPALAAALVLGLVVLALLVRGEKKG